MRLSSYSPTFRSLLAMPFLTVMLAFPANAETNPETATPQAETGAETANADSNAASVDQNSSESNGVDTGADAAAPEKPKSTVLVNIDKSTQEMTVFVDGVETYSWPVSTGRPEYATPSGNYKPTSMNEMWYSKQWDNSPMPHSIFFMKDGHAIHGTHEVKNLGKPASHGCVRLAPANATTLFMLVKETGMENVDVVLTGETPGGEYPAVASRGNQPKGYAYGVPPWFDGQYQYYQQQPQPQRRRGLFGRRWFQQQQGYYGPRGNYYVGPRGY
jgi:lipoprotein-anchoring transpeptidase ErfK/SrfK